ncbi:MAG: hypothetical protein HKN09_07645 [Saprospiraceae bacterium]|nr:hypothetical protein [Saprospiraceae bacterium]
MLRLLSLLFILFVLSSESNAQCAVACNGLINVAMNNGQTTEIKPEIVLEGNYENCANFNPTVELRYAVNGAIVPSSPFVTIDEAGQTLTVVVTENTSGNSCWGELIVENFQTTDNTVRTCFGQAIQRYTFDVSSEDPSIVLNTDACSTERDNILDYLNCVAEKNTLDQSNQYVLELQLPDEPLNGVSTLDQVFMQRHILAITPFQNACEEIAADANNDGNITVLDVIMIRELILGRIASLPDVPAWLYFNAKAINGLPGQDPGATDLKFKQSEFPLSQLEITGIKIGDLNGSAVY